MRLADIVALTGNVAAALRGVEEQLMCVEIGLETPALDAAVADLRGLSGALTAVQAIEQVRLRLKALPSADQRQQCEARILLSLRSAVRGFADLIEVVHELARAV